MGAPKGNKYWEFRNKHGRDYKYTPEELWAEAKKYFQWIEDNPLWEEELFAYQGHVTRERKYKMRAMTITGFCLFADIDESTFFSYRNNKDFINIITRIEKTIYSQKFEGAAATLLNPNIIARDLGLREQTDNTNKNTIEYVNVSKQFPDE